MKDIEQTAELVVVDVKRYKKVKNALNDSESRYRLLFENMNEGVALHEMIYDENGNSVDYRILDINTAYEKNTGIPSEKAIGSLASDLYGKKKPPYIDEYTAVVRSGKPFYFETYYEPDDKFFSISVFSPKQDQFVTVFQDISDRKHLECQKETALKTLQESENLYRSLMEKLPVGIIIIDPLTRTIESVNTRASVMFGGTAKQIVGKRCHSFVCPAEENNCPVLDLGQEVDDSERIMLHMNGSRHPILKSVARIQLSGREKLLECFVDITERNRAEFQREAALKNVRRKALELREKNEELERFTYSVSHDLKSPLVTVNIFLDHLESDMVANDKENVKRDIGYIRNGAEKMSRLLDELLKLSRIGRSTNPSEVVSLQTIVQEASALVAGRLTEHRVKVVVANKEFMLLGDRVRLVEVFQNLLDNACKFMGKQKKPLIEIGVENKDDEVVIYMRDNGIGIDPKFLPRLFNMFEKLDRGTEGDGIGLALVKRIIEVHGGRIWAESDGPGQGTTFSFTLGKNVRSSSLKEKNEEI